MGDTGVPDFFDRFPMQRVSEAALDEALDEPLARLTILFLWGRDCPNCDIAKRAMLATPERFQWSGVRWLHDNVYDDRDMATRLGLQGIPTFFVFERRRKLGRITPFPGVEAFAAAIEQQLATLSLRT